MTDIRDRKAGSGPVDPDDFNAVVDAVTALQAGGGGDSQPFPANWTAAVTDSERSLRYKVDAAGNGTLQLQLGDDTNTGAVLTVNDQGAGVVDAAIQAEATGGGSSQISAIAPPGIATLDGRGGLFVGTSPDFSAIDVYDADGNVRRFALLPTAGHVMTGVVSAPPDGDLAASQVAFWFDDTDGAAKLKIKGKSADGTVVTGQVALS